MKPPQAILMLAIWPNPTHPPQNSGVYGRILDCLRQKQHRCFTLFNISPVKAKILQPGWKRISAILKGFPTQKYKDRTFVLFQTSVEVFY
jgi:hypothetical protein